MSRVVALGVLLAFMPLAASAEIVISNSASVRSDTSASASSGGNVVESGGTVQTGDASASAHSSVTSSGGETEMDVHVETDVNGEKTNESYSEQFSGDDPVVVEVEAQASKGKSETNVMVNGEKVAGTTTASTTAEASDEESQVAAAAEAHASIFERISAAFSGFFSFLKFW